MKVGKGARLMVQECGLFEAGMGLPWCRAILSKRSDFLVEKPLVQAPIEKHGQYVNFLPKFHCVCNSIEYVWGNGKKLFRRGCKHTVPHLREHGLRTLFGIDPRTASEFVRKARKNDKARMGGANAINLAQVVKDTKKDIKFASHRRITAKSCDVV